jgi:hypothetical protein
MLKQLTMSLALGAFVAALVSASPPQAANEPAPEKAAPAKALPLNGTVVAVKGTRVEITVEGEKPSWVKKGSGIKVKGGLGKIVEVAATTVAFNTKKASTIKVGEKLTVEKGTVVPAGC